MPVRVQLSPSSPLIITPWPIVPTRMVPGFAMLHLLGVRTVPSSRARGLYPDRPGSARGAARLPRSPPSSRSLDVSATELTESSQPDDLTPQSAQTSGPQTHSLT